MAALGGLAWIIVDCSDPTLLAAFWSKVLGLELEESLEDPVQYQPLAPVAPDGPKLIFQRVPEVKQGKNRLHLDVRVEDIEVAAAHVEALGGRRLPGADYSEDGFSWRVMADPEGNEFCLITPPTPS